jgi:hypothetical protein
LKTMKKKRFNADRAHQDELILKCAEYLNDNFYKFSQGNKIKISLELIKKNMPDKNEHSGKIEIVQMGQVLIGAKPLEISIG